MKQGKSISDKKLVKDQRHIETGQCRNTGFLRLVKCVCLFILTMSPLEAGEIDFRPKLVQRPKTHKEWTFATAIRFLAKQTPIEHKNP